MLPLLLSCAAPMATLHGARTAPAGAVELHGGASMHLDGSVVGGSLDAALLAADRAQAALDQGEVPPLSAAEQDDLARAALSWALANPIPVWHGGGRVGLPAGFELGAALSTSGPMAHLAWQALDSQTGDSPVDLSLALQVQRQSFGLGLPGPVATVLRVEDLSRTDLVLPVVVGVDLEDLGFVYGGAKGVASRVEAQLFERLSEVAGVQVDLSGPVWGGGVFVGGALGWKYVFLVGELNVLAWGTQPEFLGRTLVLRSVEVVPALGLQINLYDPARRRPAAAAAGG
jgi:hypothetical protein